METVKIKNKKVSYSEELQSNVYTINFEYTKPANAHYDAQKMKGEYIYCLNIEEKRDSNGLHKVPGGWGRLNLNGKNISTRDSLRVDGEAVTLWAWVSHYEISTFNALTEADAETISKILEEVSKTSCLFTLANITERAQAFEMVGELKEAAQNIKELKEKLAEAEAAAASLLGVYDVTEEQAAMIIQLTSDGLPVESIRATVKELTR